MKIKTVSLSGANVIDLNVNSRSDIELTYYNNFYHYWENAEWISDRFTGLLGQVMQKDGYFFPIFSESESYHYTSHDSQSSYNPILSTTTLMGGGNFFSRATSGADVNTVVFDFHKNTTNNTSRKRLNESQKSRSYFCYDTVNDRLVFQRASNEAPNTSAETISTGLLKSWDNFGLNPIGYFDMGTLKLGYINKKNNKFIHDMIAGGGLIYAISIKPENTNYTTADTTKSFEATEFSYTGAVSDFDTLDIYDGFVGYGLCFNNYELSYVANNSGIWQFRSFDLRYDTSNIVDIGSDDNYSTPTGAIYYNNKYIMFIFKNNKLQYVDINNRANDIEYIATNLDSDILGGYIVRYEGSDNFTAKFEDNLITYLSQVRGLLLDLTDKTVLQGLLMLCNMANKFMYIDETDSLRIYDNSSVTSSYNAIDEIISLKIKDTESYSDLNVNSYIVNEDDIFEWEIETGDYENSLLGSWSGSDASFSVNIIIASSSSLRYTISSDSDLLDENNIYTTITGITDWKNISISKTGYNIKLSFVDGDLVAVTPTTNTVFNAIFNYRLLKKVDVPSTASNSDITPKKTKTIDNRFISRNIAKIFVNDVKSYFLGNKRIFEVVVAKPLYEIEKRYLRRLNFYYNNLLSLDCFIMSVEHLENNGTTKLVLKEK